MPHPGEAVDGARPGLAYAALNLRHNPFGELDLDVRAELAVVEVQRFAWRLRRPGFAVQFLGDKGRGKTTHLVALRRLLPEAPYVHLPEVGRVPVPRAPLVMVDEAQRLGRWRRWRLFRPTRSLALGTHEDYTAELRRAGFEVAGVQVAEALDGPRLCEILNRRIEWARRGSGPIPRVRLATAQRLAAEFDRDLRAVQRRLYTWIQELRTADAEV